MAITDTQKVDYLWKKLGYGVTKTDINSNKAATNESIASPLLLRGDKVWSDAGTVPAVIPAATSSVVQIYDDSGNGTATVETTADATATAFRTWKTGATDWIPPEMGSTYQVKVYIDDASEAAPQSTGTQIFAAGSGNNDEWFFDYQSGVLHFIGTNLPSGLSGSKVIYVAGARYIGGFGTTSAQGNFGNVQVSANSITTTDTNGDLTLAPNGTGDVIIDSGLNVDSGVLFVDEATNRVGVNNTSPTVDLDVTGTVKISGDLQVDGTTTTINSVEVTVDDPIFTVGGDTAPSSDDNKDRGIAFRWHNGSAAKVGFFGFDDSTGRFSFVPDSTETSGVISGTTGDIEVQDIYARNGTLTGTLAVTGTTTLTDNVTANANLSVEGNTTLGNANTDTITFTAKAASSLLADTDATYDLGDSTNSFNNAYIETANVETSLVVTGNVGSNLIPNADATRDLGSNGVKWNNLYVETITADANAGIAGNLSVDGNTTLGNAGTDTITFTAKATSSILNDTDSTYDLGDTTNRWANIFVDTTTGTNANLSNIRIATAGANEIDTSSGNLTIDSAGGTTTIDDNAAITGTANITGDTEIVSTTVSTSTTTGALVVGGGVGIGENLFVGGNVDVAGNVNITGNIVIGGNSDYGDANTDSVTFAADIDSNIVPDTNDAFDLGSATQAWRDVYLSEAINFKGATTENEIIIPTNLADGLSIKDSAGDLMVFTTTTGNQSLTVTPNTTISGNTTLGGTLDVTGISNFNATTSSTSNTTGAVIIDGGLGLAENLHMGGDLDVDGNANIGGTFDVTGATNLNNTTQSTNATSGALIVDGGVGVAKNLNVGGDLGVTGALAGATANIGAGNLIVNTTVDIDIGVNIQNNANFNIDNSSSTNVFNVVGSTGATTIAGPTVINNTFATSNNVTFTDNSSNNFNIDNSSNTTVFDVEMSTGNTIISGDTNINNSLTLTDNSSDNFTIKNSSNNTTFIVDMSTGNTIISGTFQSGAATISSAKISDLTAGRVVLAGTSGEIEDSANLTFDGSTLAVTGAATVSTNLTVTQNATINGNTVLNGNTDIGNATTDTVTFTAKADSHLLNTTDGTYDLGDTTNRWRAIYVDDATITNNLSLGGNLNLTGNLTVSGTTTTVDAATLAIEDPIITLGGTSAPSSDDNKDRGVEFNYHDGSNAKVGFFGFDDSTGEFTFIPAGTNSSEVFSGTTGNVRFLNGIFEGTGALEVPTGTTAQRPTAVAGQIRFNTTDTSFEGYDGSAWASLGGVKDVDQDTFIRAETSAGTDNDALEFFTANTERMQIDSSGDIGFGASVNKVTIAGATGNTAIAGTLDVEGVTNFNDTTGSTSTTSGAVIIDGGAGIAENLFVGGTLNVNGLAVTATGQTVAGAYTITTTGSNDAAVTSGQAINFTAATDISLDIDASSNITFDSGGTTFGGVAKVSGSNNLEIKSGSTTAVSFTGANASFAGNLDIAVDVDVNSNFTIAGATGNTSVAGTFASTNTTASTSKTTGALVVAGGAGISGDLYVGTSVDIATNLTIGGSTTVGGILDEDNMASNSATQLATQQSIKAYVDGQTGADIDAGAPTDGSWSTGGAYQHFNNTDKVVNVLDDLNEIIENVRSNTFVRSVTFVADTTAGGAGTTVTLTTTVDGNANQFVVDWGDGNTDTTSDSTPSHTYTSNSGSPFTVQVTASNTSGAGTGSSASSTRTNYIVIYTADPAVSFEYYRASSGGSALSGNDLWVKEGDSLYMKNTTTNTSMATVAYSMAWGDGSSDDSIANDAAAGGVGGARLQHTWGAGTHSGTSRDTTTLTLSSHTTADPSVIPATGSVLLKVYDDAPTAPDGLSSKTIAFSGSTGTSPKLAANADDNTGGATLSAGDSVSRTTATSGTIDTVAQSSFAYNADTGTLSAFVNGSADGAKAFTSGDDSGTYTSLVIDSESDYQLLNSGGTAVSFAASTFYPGLYKGFKAHIAKTASAVSKGINSFQLQHSATGNSNTIEFVKDDVTATPTTTIGTIAAGTNGTFRYISGIPYYNSGSPNITLSGITLANFIGQTYRDTAQVVEVTSGTNAESTSQSAIATQYYTYANIDGASTFLSGGVPVKDTGNGSAYAIGALTVDITSSSVRTVETIKARAYNVNGTGSYSSDATTKLQVHTASQSGISEIAIAVSDSLGAGFDDDGKRITDFKADTTNTPSYTNSTNFYTNAPYSESADPGVAGTKEATLRLGKIKHDVTNYSSGYLPAGPNRSSDTGTQYFTFAFRRTVMANFTLNITSSTGVEGVFIAAPGTGIDTASSLNGWLDCSTAYAGSGVPGANTGSGGNGSNGCASTSGDVIGTGALSGSFTMTLGSENATNATGNVVLVRIALASGDEISALSIS